MLRIQKSNNYQLVSEFLKNNFSSPTHWPDWNLVISKYFSTNFYYLLLFNRNELIGICPIHEVKKLFLENLFSGQFLYNPYGGWILNQKTLKNVYDLHFINQFSFLQVFSLPQITEFELGNLNKDLIYFKTLIIDLNKNIEQIWHECIDSKRRNMIRKAEKNNIKIEIIKNKFSDDWYNLYAESNKNYKLQILSKSFFDNLFDSASNITFLILNAYYLDQIISSSVIVLDKFYAIYWLGNNSKQFNLGQSELIQWIAIKKAKEMGCKYYDLCYIEKDRLPHIYEFKKGFANWEVDIPLFVSKSLAYKIINKLTNVFRIL